MSSTPPPPVSAPPEDGPSRVPVAPPGERRALSAVAALLTPFVVAIVVWSAFEWMRETDASRALVVLVALVVGVGGVFALFLGMDRITDLFPLRWAERIRPWVFVGPALLLLGVFLVYPVVNTIMCQLPGCHGHELRRVGQLPVRAHRRGMLRSIRNTVAWMIVVPLISVSVGLVFALLADRLPRGESISKSLIFLPMAVSFVGASVVFSLIYDFRVFGNQTGLLNGLWVGLGNDPIAWLSLQPWNNLFLMVIMIWMQTGFAMVILSAAIKSVPDELLEAARIDGATEFQVFRRIIIPSIMSAIVVVTTAMVINVLKVFDIVFVMTNGEAGTEVIAERMIRWFFRNGHFGRGAAIAVVLFLAVIPVMIWNVKRFREEEEIR
jgi:alpha-glucoside transport system permease protein